eukprot:RCo041154
MPYRVSPSSPSSCPSGVVTRLPLPPEFPERYRAAIDAASFILEVPVSALEEDPKYRELRRHIAIFAMVTEASRRWDMAMFSTCMLVSALFLTISAALLFNPPAFGSFQGSELPSFETFASRLYFYSLLVSVVLFFSSIGSGTTLYFQFYYCVNRECEVPTFFWKMSHIILLTWVPMLAGIFATCAGGLALVFMTFPRLDAWIGIGFSVAIGGSVAGASHYSDWQWRLGYHRRVERVIALQLEELRTGVAVRMVEEAAV